MQAAAFDLLLIKRIVILRGCKRDHRIFRREGLDKRAARLLGAAAAADHLCKKLKRPLKAAVILRIQRGIGRQHADQRHIWKVKPLRDHLRPDYYIIFSG